MSEEIIQRAPVDKIVGFGGGFLLEEYVKCNDSSVDITQVRCFHEEGDIITHCASSESEMLVVSARDTDVSLLLLRLAHVDSIKKTIFGLKQEHIKDECIFPSDRLSWHVVQSLTGSDTTSFMYGHGNRISSCYLVLDRNHLLM